MFMFVCVCVSRCTGGQLCPPLWVQPPCLCMLRDRGCSCCFSDVTTTPPHRAGLHAFDCRVLIVVASSLSHLPPPPPLTPVLSPHQLWLPIVTVWVDIPSMPEGCQQDIVFFITGGLIKRETTHMCGHSAVQSTNRTSNFMSKWVILWWCAWFQMSLES